MSMRHHTHQFTRYNFLVELIAGAGGALLVGVPGLVVGSYLGFVYDTLWWAGWSGESAGALLGLLIGSAIGGWSTVYFAGQLIHDERSGVVSFTAALAGLVVSIFLFDSSLAPLPALTLLSLPLFAATLGYNLTIPHRSFSTSVERPHTDQSFTDFSPPPVVRVPAVRARGTRAGRSAKTAF